MTKDSPKMPATGTSGGLEQPPGPCLVDHPLIRHHLVRLRDETTGPVEFRLLVGRLAVLLAYEATKDLMGKDFWPYGVAENAKELEDNCRYSHEQHLSAGLLSVDELFVPETMEMDGG